MVIVSILDEPRKVLAPHGAEALVKVMRTMNGTDVYQDSQMRMYSQNIVDAKKCLQADIDSNDRAAAIMASWYRQCGERYGWFGIVEVK